MSTEPSKRISKLEKLCYWHSLIMCIFLGSTCNLPSGEPPNKPGTSPIPTSVPTAISSNSTNSLPFRSTALPLPSQPYNFLELPLASSGLANPSTDELKKLQEDLWDHGVPLNPFTFYPWPND